MPTLNIDLDATVLAHLVSAGDGDTINISITLGERKVVNPDPAFSKPRGPLASLMEAGLLSAGDQLYFHQSRANRTGRATLTVDGQLIVEGHSRPISSPSAAAELVTGKIINGWTLWHLGDGSGPTLDALRKRLQAQEDLLYETTVMPSVDPSA